MHQLGVCIRDEIELHPDDVRAALARVHAELEPGKELSRTSQRFIKLGIGRYLGIGGTFGGKLVSGSNVISGGWIPSNLKVGSTLSDSMKAIPGGTTVVALDPETNTITMSAKALLDVPRLDDPEKNLPVIRYNRPRTLDLEQAFGLRPSRRGSPRIPIERQQEVAKAVLVEYLKGGSLELAAGNAGWKVKPQVGKTRALEMFRANDGYALRILKIERLHRKGNKSLLWSAREEAQLKKYYDRRNKQLAAIFR